MTREEALKLAQDEVDYVVKSHVEAARSLALFILHDEKNERRQVYENLSEVQHRCTMLLEQRRMLVRMIDELSLAPVDAREQLILGMLTIARSMV